MGYEYLPLAKGEWNESTNIFKEIFLSNVQRLNPELSESELLALFDNISLASDKEEFGTALYEILTSSSGETLIDFEDFTNNKLQVVTELPCIKNCEEFRPDIPLLINGMPLAFIEVIKPNILDGIQVKLTKDVLKAFNDIINPTIKTQNIMAVENERLAKLRDWLLLMLMNDQVKIG